MPSIRQLISRAAHHGLTGLGIVLIATAGLVAQVQAQAAAAAEAQAEAPPGSRG